jgi:hypothetical protein
VKTLFPKSINLFELLKYLVASIFKNNLFPAQMTDDEDEISRKAEQWFQSYQNPRKNDSFKRRLIFHSLLTLSFL